MKLLSVILLCFLGCYAKDCPSNNKKINSKLICYYSKLIDIDTCYCTHVILPANADLKSIENLRQKLNGVKILLTVNEFNQGLVETVKQNKIDGLELNLKKLDSKNDINEFINTVRTRLGNDLYLALSVPSKAELLVKYYDMKALTKATDLFILQTAFLGASKNVTFHPSRLSGMWDMQNTDSVVDLVTGLGAPLSRLAITAPVQAFKFSLQDQSLTIPGSPALELSSITRKQLCDRMNNGQDWTLERDQDQAGPYIFREKEWISFEDATSMDIKAKYSRVRGLAGLALKDLSQDEDSTKCGGSLLAAAHTGLSKQTRAPRAAVLRSLEREILGSGARPLDKVHVSPYRISRVIDVEGHVHVIRQDTRTEFECSRQGYFVHPHSCGRFYRCVKFDQQTEEFSVFEFDCPAGLAFDARVEVCVWPGSLPDGAPCSGSSEIAPVPRERFACPTVQGYYADPENCRWFFACLDHGKSGLTAYEFRCPFGLVFDEKRLLCEWPWLVPTCSSGYTGQESVEYFGGSGKSTIVQGANQQHLGVQTQLQGANIYDSYDGLGSLGVVALGGYQGDLNALKESLALGYNNQGQLGHFNLGYGNGESQFGTGFNDNSGQGVILTGLEGNAGKSEFQVNNGESTSFGNNGQSSGVYLTNSGFGNGQFDSNLEHHGNGKINIGGQYVAGSNGEYSSGGDIAHASVQENSQNIDLSSLNQDEKLQNTGAYVNLNVGAIGGQNYVQGSNLDYSNQQDKIGVIHFGTNVGQVGLNSQSSGINHGESYNAGINLASAEYQGNSGANEGILVNSGLNYNDQNSGSKSSQSFLQHNKNSGEKVTFITQGNAGDASYLNSGAKSSQSTVQYHGNNGQKTVLLNSGLNYGKLENTGAIEYHGNNGEQNVHYLDSGVQLNKESNSGNLNYNYQYANLQPALSHSISTSHVSNVGSFDKYNGDTKYLYAPASITNIGLSTGGESFIRGDKLDRNLTSAYNYATNYVKFENNPQSAYSTLNYYQPNVQKTHYQNVYKTPSVLNIQTPVSVPQYENYYQNVGSAQSHASLVQHHDIKTPKVVLTKYQTPIQTISVTPNYDTQYYQNNAANSGKSHSSFIQHHQTEIETPTVVLNKVEQPIQTISVTPQYEAQYYQKSGASSGQSHASFIQHHNAEVQQPNVVLTKYETPKYETQYYQNQGASSGKSHSSFIQHHSTEVKQPNVVLTKVEQPIQTISVTPQYEAQYYQNSGVSSGKSHSSFIQHHNTEVQQPNVVLTKVEQPIQTISVTPQYEAQYYQNSGVSSGKSHSSFIQHHNTEVKQPNVVLTKVEQPIQTISVTPQYEAQYYQNSGVSSGKSHSSFIQHHNTEVKQPNVVITKVEQPIQTISVTPQYEAQYYQNSGVSSGKSHSSFIQHHNTEVKQPNVVLTKVEQQVVSVTPQYEAQYYQNGAASSGQSHASFIQHHNTEVKQPNVVLTKVEQPVLSVTPQYETQYYQNAGASSGQSHASFIQHHATEVKTPNVVLTKVEQPVVSVTPQYETQYYQNAGASSGQSHASFIQHHATEVRTPNVVLTKVEQPVVSVTPQYETQYYQNNGASSGQSHSSFIQHHATEVKTPNVVLTKVEQPVVSVTPQYETQYYQNAGASSGQSHASFIQHHATEVKTPNVVLTKVQQPVVSVTPQYETQYYQNNGASSAQSHSSYQQQHEIKTPAVETHYYQQQNIPVVQQPSGFVQKIETPKYETQYYQNSGASSGQSHSSFIQHHNLEVKEAPVVKKVAYQTTYTQPAKVEYYGTQTVSSTPQYVESYSYAPQKQTVSYVKQDTREYLPPQQKISTVYVSSTPKPYLPPKQVYVSTTPKYAVFQEFVQPKQTFEIKKTIIPNTYYGSVQQQIKTVTLAPRIIQTYQQPKQIIHTYQQPKQIIQNVKYETRDYLPPKQKVYISTTPKPYLPPKEVYVSTTPKYAVFQEFIQPKQILEVKKTVQPAVVNQYQYENSDYANFESNLNYKQNYYQSESVELPKVQQQTIYYSTQKPVTVKNYQTEYIISTPKPNFISTIAPIVKQTPRARTKVVELTKFDVIENVEPQFKYYDSRYDTSAQQQYVENKQYVSSTPAYSSTQKYVKIQEVPTQKYNYYDSRYDTTQQKYEEKYVAPAQIYVSTEKPIKTQVVEEISQPQYNYYDSRYDTSSQNKYEESSEKYVTPTQIYVSTQKPIKTQTVEQEIYQPQYNYYDSRYDTSSQEKYENSDKYVSSTEKYISSTEKYVTPTQVYVSTAKPIRTQTEIPLPEFKYYDSRLGGGQQVEYKENNQYLKETSDYYDNNYETVSTTVRPVQRKKVVTTTQIPIETYVDDSYEAQYVVTTQKPRPVLRKKIVTTTTAIPYEEEYVITTLRPKSTIRPVIKKKKILTTTTTTAVPEYYEYSSERAKSVKITPRPKSKTIVRVNDFHPFLTTKLGAQCICTSNTVKLRQQSKDESDYDYNVPVTKITSDGPAAYDNEEPGVYVVDNSEVSDDYNYEAQKVVTVTKSPVKSTTNAVQPAPTPVYTIRKKVTSSVAPEIYLSSTPVSDVKDEVFLKFSRNRSKDEKIAEAVNEGVSLVKSAIKGYIKETVKEEVRNFDRFGPGGWRSRDETLQGSVDCQRAGLFRHPTQCNKFYACHWDCKKERYTLHVFNCPVHLTFDSSQGACNWPSKGPACTDNTLLPNA